MSVNLGLEEPDRQIKAMIEDMKQYKAEMDKRSDLAPNTRKATDDELLALVHQKVQEYPPQQMTTSDGRQVMMSPWLAAISLPTTQGANGDMQRLRELVYRQQGGQ